MRGYLGSGAIYFMLYSATASLLMLDLFFDSVNCSVVISLPFLFFNVGVDMIGLVFRSCAGAGAGIASSVVVGISVGRTSSFLLSIKIVGIYLGLIYVQCLFQITSSTWTS